MNQFTSKASGPFDTLEALGQALRERTKLAMVEALRTHGDPLTCSRIAELTGYSPNAIGRVAFESRRTFETELPRGAKARQVFARLQVYLHPHLKGHA